MSPSPLFSGGRPQEQLRGRIVAEQAARILLNLRNRLEGRSLSAWKVLKYRKEEHLEKTVSHDKIDFQNFLIVTHFLHVVIETFSRWKTSGQQDRVDKPLLSA